jgi:hypothetical protein
MVALKVEREQFKVHGNIIHKFTPSTCFIHNGVAETEVNQSLVVFQCRSEGLRGREYWKGQVFQEMYYSAKYPGRLQTCLVSQWKPFIITNKMKFSLPSSFPEQISATPPSRKIHPLRASGTGLISPK